MCLLPQQCWGVGSASGGGGVCPWGYWHPHYWSEAVCSREAKVRRWQEMPGLIPSFTVRSLPVWWSWAGEAAVSIPCASLDIKGNTNNADAAVTSLIIWHSDTHLCKTLLRTQSVDPCGKIPFYNPRILVRAAVETEQSPPKVYWWLWGTLKLPAYSWKQ